MTFFQNIRTTSNAGFLLAAVFLVFGSSVPSTPLRAEEAAPEKVAARPAPALALPAFKKIIESGRPSAEKNFILTKLTGEWHYKMALWAVPGAEPKWTKGVVRNEMTLDERFLSSSFVGELDVGGNDAMVKGQGLIGYDNAKKSFTSVWVDTLTTSLMTGTGKYDPKSRVITETGQFTNPLTGTEAKFRSELQFTGDEDYRRTIFVIGKSGKETKLMEFDCSKLPSNDSQKH